MEYRGKPASTVILRIVDLGYSNIGYVQYVLESLKMSKSKFDYLYAK